MFVANRVSEILESTTIDEWFHVPTGNILADTVNRGITAEALKETDGLKGPFFFENRSLNLWTRWFREYVPRLKNGANWVSYPESHLKTGDLVPMTEDIS